MIEDIAKKTATILVTMSEEQLEAYSVSIVNKVIDVLTPKKEDKLLTQAETAKRLGASKPTLWRWEKQGYLIPIRIGGKVYYKESDLTKLMEE